MLQYFGTVTPSLEERTVLFNKLWAEYKQNEINLDGFAVADLNKIREMYGPFKVIRKGRFLRFKDREDLLFVTLQYVKKTE